MIEKPLRLKFETYIFCLTKLSIKKFESILLTRIHADAWSDENCIQLPNLQRIIFEFSKSIPKTEYVKCDKFQKNNDIKSFAAKYLIREKVGLFFDFKQTIIISVFPIVPNTTKNSE